MTYAEAMDARLLLAEISLGRHIRSQDRKELSDDELTKQLLRERGMVS